MKLILFLLLPALMVYGGGGQEDTLTILYTSSLNGNLDGCDCKSGPIGGLVKRAAFLRTRLNRDSTILVDTGDILDVYPDEFLAEEIFEVYKELDYSAVALGDQEFSNGFDNLLHYRDCYPLFCHNLVVCPDKNRCVFFSIEPLIINKMNIRIGLFALIDPEVFILYPEGFKKALKISPPKAAAENMVKNLEDVDLIILLYHGSYENAKALAGKVKGIDVLIFGHEQRLIEPHTINGTILASPGNDGNRLGELKLMMDKKGKIKYSNQFRLFQYEIDEDDPAVRERIIRYKTELKGRLKSGKS